MAPLLKEAACCADALRGAESSELARGWRCAVFYKQEGGVVTCAAGEILPPGVHDQVEDACVRPIVGFKQAHQPVTSKLAARGGDGLGDAIGMHEPVRPGGQRDGDSVASGEAALPKEALARTSQLAPSSHSMVAVEWRVLRERRRMNPAAPGVEQQRRERHGVVIRVHGLIEHVVQFDKPNGERFRRAA